MPILEITTNVKVNDEKAFTSALAKEGINVLGMDKYWTVMYKYNEGLIFAGTHEPAFYMTILTVLGLPTSNNSDYSKKFFAFLETELGVPHDRGYIVFNDPGPDRLGFQSTTFDVLLKQMGK
ncbi:Tautomerase/MIF [Gymnopus androsaceus JB14]|uniref:L-dopachrome isomerase n=1 Tax=Gymnopus androsaceus JB14 TaxID=1447944 RepID=A0A6A4GM14_9AGAR|nr:Tautomerase/MIF [Gymnopus androsaceus JB14]